MWVRSSQMSLAMIYGMMFVAKRNRWVPFSWWPANWGLEGKRRQEEYVKYHYEEGRELDEKLLDILYDTEESKDSLNYRVAKLQLEYKYGDINENEYEKALATAHDDPYFRVLSGDFVTGKNGDGQMTFELDWNTRFAEQLSANGWPGYSEDQIVNNWFEDVCRQMVTDDVEEEEGGHDFIQQAGRRIKRQNLGGDHTSVS